MEHEILLIEEGPSPVDESPVKDVTFTADFIKESEADNTDE